MPKNRIAVARMVFGGWERFEIGNWMIEVAISGYLRQDILETIHWPRQVFPVDVARNQIVKEALKREVDYLFMVDADCGPPRGWYDATLNFLVAHHGPAAVVCPYAGMDGDPMVFKWTTNNHRPPIEHAAMKRMTRDECGRLTGFRPLADFGCHLVGYSMEAFRRVDPPWYSMTTSPDGCSLIGGEDSNCHQRLALKGTKLYGAFDFWAEHWKEDPRGRPIVIAKESIDQMFFEQAKAILEFERVGDEAVRMAQEEKSTCDGPKQG